jgi:hypothetical protein
MRSRILIISVFVALMVATMLTAIATPLAADDGAAAKAPADPISGEWAVSFTVAGMTVPGVFKLKLEHDTVTGTVETDHTGPGTLRDGSWVDNLLKCDLVFAKHETIGITGKLSGDKLVGEFRTEGMQGTWEATRTAPASARSSALRARTQSR